MTDISGSNTVSDGYNGHYTPTTEEVCKVEQIYVGRDKPLTRWTWKVTFTDGTYLQGKAWTFQKARLRMLATLKSWGETE